MKTLRNIDGTRALFAMAHTDIHSVPFNNHSRTMRLVVPINAPTRKVWVQLSNRCGTRPLHVGAASVCRCDTEGLLATDSLLPLTVGGLLAFEIAPGEELYSDAIPLVLQPGDQLAISLYYPESERLESGNWVGAGCYRSKPGNFTAEQQLPHPGLVTRFARTMIAAGVTNNVTTVARVVAQCDSPGRVLACFGDSITQQSNWTAPLQRRLHRSQPGEISLCNLGIAGNRMLHCSPQSVGGLYGEAGMGRFVDEVLALPGLTHCIAQIGTNDIGLPGWNGTPEHELPTLELYAAAMQDIATRLHQAGVLAYVGTLCPRPLSGSYTQEREELRQAINHWIRSNPYFDAVLDFDAVLRRDDGEMGMQEGYALPDGLHPSPLGGLMLAKSIDLELFREVPHG